jgi:hypothetical protein
VVAARKWGQVLYYDISEAVEGWEAWFGRAAASVAGVALRTGTPPIGLQRFAALRVS